MNLGGIENVIMQIYRNIDRNRLQFDFVVHLNEENYYEKEIKKMGGRLFRIPYISRDPKRHILGLKKLLCDHPEYKIVHVHTTYAISYFDVKVAKEMGRTVIVHSHNSGATKLHTVAHKILKNKMDRMTDYKVACSQMAANWMFKHTNEVSIWKNAIDLTGFKFDKRQRVAIRKRYGCGDNYIIGNVARLSYQKNQAYLVEIFEKYHNEINQNSVLWLIGDGEDREKLQQKVKLKKLDHCVYFMGKQDNVKPFLMAMDVFCFSSRYEGFSVALVEAEASGLPVIGFNIFDETLGITPHCYNVGQYRKIEDWIYLLEKARKRKYDREKDYNLILKSGFSIKEQSKNISSFYYEIIGDK